MVVWLIILVLRRQRQEEPWSSLASQPNWIWEPWIPLRDRSRKQGEWLLENTWGWSLASTCACIHVQRHTHTHTHTYVCAHRCVLEILIIPNKDTQFTSLMPPFPPPSLHTGPIQLHSRLSSSHRHTPPPCIPNISFHCPSLRGLFGAGERFHYRQASSKRLMGSHDWAFLSTKCS